MSNALEKMFSSKSLNPFRELSDLQSSFDRFFNEFRNWKKSNGDMMMEFQPSCDIEEEGDHFTMKFDLPGVVKNDIKVEINDNQLTVRAYRKDEKRSESKKRYLSECFYGQYMRTFDFPGPIDEKKIDAKFENGVLTVTVPKMPAFNAKTVSVH